MGDETLTAPTGADNIIEEWKPVVGYETRYEVSSIGGVRSLDHDRKYPRGGFARHAGQMLVPDASTGYNRVNLCVDGRHAKMLVHRAVALAFIPGGNPRQHINHKDGNKLNNVVSNLEWCSPRENVLHAWRMGLNHAHAGEDHYNARLCDRDVRVIRDAASRGIPQRTLANVFQVTEVMISSICLFKSWTHLQPESEVA